MLQLVDKRSSKLSIPLIDYRTDQDCCHRLYRRAIYNTLLYLKPKYCFEIGSYTFQSSSVFSRYYQENQPEGKLITADIALWNRGGSPDRVYPIIFWPYDENIEDEHGGIEVYYKNYKEIAKHDLALELNLAELLKEMFIRDIKKFDFTFVDGSHSKTSFQNDLKLAKMVTKLNGYILIDDIYEKHYSQHKVYEMLKKKNNFYEYDNGWNPVPGFALIKNKELTLDYC